jgi:metal-responsive CopG/Arc/MetJ family transcriptional regulator
MMTVMRTIIEIHAAQLEALDDVCRRDSISRAEAIRRAIDAMIASEAPARAKQAFGMWRGRGIDGVKYQAALRREWDA